MLKVHFFRVFFFPFLKIVTFFGPTREFQSFWDRVQPSGGGRPPLPLSPVPSSSGDAPPSTPLVMPSRRWMLPRFLSRDESEQLFPKDFEAALQGGGGRDQQVLRSGQTYLI